jgi:hypothetical protein
MQFAAVTVAIVMGAIAERGRVLPAMVFSFLWATIVYCPIACWVWNVNGWAFNYGVLDYAGKSYITETLQNQGNHVKLTKCSCTHRWWTCRDCFWCQCPRLFSRAREAPREDASQLPTSQRLTHHAWYNSSVVWMARVQRWFCLRCKPPCCDGLLEL